MARVDDKVWFEFIESKAFSKQVRELGVEVLARIQSDLVQNPERGAVVKGTHGRTLLKNRGKSLTPSRNALTNLEASMTIKHYPHDPQIVVIVTCNSQRVPNFRRRS